ncbi:MAG: hypothetical protein R3A48_00960 [Polyangiales bacterium]
MIRFDRSPGKPTRDALAWCQRGIGAAADGSPAGLADGSDILYRHPALADPQGSQVGSERMRDRTSDLRWRAAKALRLESAQIRIM